MRVAQCLRVFEPGAVATGHLAQGGVREKVDRGRVLALGVERRVVLAEMNIVGVVVRRSSSVVMTLAVRGRRK